MKNGSNQMHSNFHSCAPYGQARTRFIKGKNIYNTVLENLNEPKYIRTESTVTAGCSLSSSNDC